MQVNQVIRVMVSRSGKSPETVSAELGRSKTFVRNVSNPSRSPALATVAEIADALGYRLELVDTATGERVGSIEPPRG